MKKLWQGRLHRGARVLGWTAGVSVIALAVLMALAQLLLPLLAQHPQWVAAQLSERLQRPVSFASTEGRWTATGPLFVMHDVIVGVPTGESGTPLLIPESELSLDFGGWLLPSRHLLNVRVRDLQLNVLHDAAGAWYLNGMRVGDRANQKPLSLGHLSVGLWLNNLRLTVTDAKAAAHYTVVADQLRLSQHGARIRAGALLHRAGVAGTLRLAGEFSEDGGAGRAWLGGNKVDLQPLLKGVDLDGYIAQGHGDIGLWLDWRDHKITRSVARLDLDKLTLTTPAGASAAVNALHGSVGLRRSADGYQVRWLGDDGGVLLLVGHRPGAPDATATVTARNLQLAPLLPWLALQPDSAPALSQWLGSGRPQGELTRVTARWSQSQGLHALDVAFRGLAIQPVGKLPGVDHLHGVLRGDAEALSLQLPAQPVTLQLPQLFHQPVVLDALSGTLAFWPQGGDWHLGADAVDFASTDYAGQLRGEMTLPAGGGAPFVDMYATLDHADVAAVKRFWPWQSMSPATVAWLDRALVSGQIEDANVVLRGNMGDWPFRQHEGRFEALAPIKHLTLDYGAGWPQAEGVDALASFVNSGMLVQTSAGHSLGVTATQAVALIPDFHDGLLDLNVQGGGTGASVMDFVRKSPIGRNEADTLAKLRLGGNVTFGFHLSLPLGNDADMRLTGTAQLSKVDLEAQAWALQLDQISGPLQFDANGLQSGSLSASFRGQPAQLQFAIAGGNADPATAFSAQLRGNFSADDLLHDYPSLGWISDLTEGRSNFTVGFNVAHATNNQAALQSLTIDSPLVGMALRAPAPLHKIANVSMPLHVGLNLPVDGSALEVSLGQIVRGRFRLATATQPLSATLAFGTKMPVDLPAQGIRVRGDTPQLDVTGWVQQVAGGGGQGGPSLESLSVRTAQASWFGHSIGALQIQAKPEADVLNIDVDGAAMAGKFNVPMQQLNKRGVTARLQRLYWPKAPVAPAAAANHTASTPPATTINSNGSDVLPPSSDPAYTGVNPAALPPFHLWIGDLRFGAAKLGEARLETWPTAEGLHIEQLRALSSSVQINATGDWNGTASNSHTHMRINFAAEDLGAMLDAFGYPGLVNGGKTTDRLDATWPGSPSSLSLANMTGSLNVNVEDGRIPEASSPGVGRLLGLVSLAELPRRLTLDFGDVFGKGLAFDSITADFTLANGEASTSNMRMDGSAANISMSGSTGLRSGAINQQVLVVPHIGNSLPLVGAVVGGPIGAAAGFAVQGLLGKGLNKAARARYQVTGTLDKPVMTLIESRGVTAPEKAPLKAPMKAPANAPASAPAGSASVPAPAPAASAVH
ncbi:MAG: YhdP family protein [Rhodanobacter sp.]